MQLTERVKNCNGCSACVVGCKYVCVKMEGPAEGRTKKQPVVNEDGCSKCNACMLYCPLYNPVQRPEFKEYYESQEFHVFKESTSVINENNTIVRDNLVNYFKLSNNEYIHFYSDIKYPTYLLRPAT